MCYSNPANCSTGHQANQANQASQSSKPIKQANQANQANRANQAHIKPIKPIKPIKLKRKLKPVEGEDKDTVVVAEAVVEGIALQSSASSAAVCFC